MKKWIRKKPGYYEWWDGVSGFPIGEIEIGRHSGTWWWVWRTADDWRYGKGHSLASCREQIEELKRWLERGGQ